MNRKVLENKQANKEGWHNLGEWKTSNIVVKSKYFELTKVYCKISDKNEPFGFVYSTCRTIFRNNTE